VLAAELAIPAQCELAEGPVWDHRRGVLLWVDILGERVHTADPVTGAHRHFATGVPVGAAGLTTGGRLVLALVDHFATCAADGTGLLRVAGLTTRAPAVRFNDGKPDPWGGFCAGTMRWQAGAEPSEDGCLYRLAPDGTVAELVAGVRVSNGLDWSDDRRTFYYIDSPAGGIDAFDTDPDAGALSGRRRLLDIAPADGMPDGLTLDADGCLWVAVWGSGELRRYTPDGAIDTVVSVPARQVTSAAFGGADLGTLFITTAREDFTPADRAAEPHAGDIFACAPGVTGRLPFRYAG